MWTPWINFCCSALDKLIQFEAVSSYTVIFEICPAFAKEMKNDLKINSYVKFRETSKIQNLCTKYIYTYNFDSTNFEQKSEILLHYANGFNDF